MRDPEKIDRRVMYTRMFLRESLLALMRVKPIAKITPTELCRHAKMNRNTFYSHYDSPEALLASIEDEFYDQVERSIEQSLAVGGISNVLTEICQAISDHHDLCVVLFSEYGDKAFLGRIISLAHESTLAEWQAAGVRADLVDIEMLYGYTVNGAVSVIEQWVRGGMGLSPKEIAEFIHQATAHGIHSFT